MLAGLEGHREKCVYVWCVSSYGSEGAKQPPVYRRSTRAIPVAFRKSQQPASVCAGASGTQRQPASVRAGKTPSLGRVFFPHKHPHGFVKKFFSEARTQKAKVHGEATGAHASPGMEHVCIIYLLKFYVFM